MIHHPTTHRPFRPIMLSDHIFTRSSRHPSFTIPPSTNHGPLYHPTIPCYRHPSPILPAIPPIYSSISSYHHPTRITRQPTTPTIQPAATHHRSTILHPTYRTVLASHHPSHHPIAHHPLPITHHLKSSTTQHISSVMHHRHQALIFPEGATRHTAILHYCKQPRRASGNSVLLRIPVYSRRRFRPPRARSFLHLLSQWIGDSASTRPRAGTRRFTNTYRPGQTTSCCCRSCATVVDPACHTYPTRQACAQQAAV